MSDAGSRCRAVHAAVCYLLNNGETPTLAAVRRVLRGRVRGGIRPSVVSYEVAILGAFSVGAGWWKMTEAEQAAARAIDQRRPTSAELQIWDWLRKWPSEEARKEAVRRLATGLVADMGERDVGGGPPPHRHVWRSTAAPEIYRCDCGAVRGPRAGALVSAFADVGTGAG